MASIQDILGLDNLESWFNDIGQGISSIPGQFQTLGSSISNLPSGLADALKGSFGGLSQQLGGLGSGLGSMWDYVQGLPDQFGQQINSLGSDLWGGLDNLGNQFSDWGNQALGGIQDVGNQVTSMGNDLWGNIQNFGGNILDWVKQIPSSIRDAATQGWDTIKGSLGDMGNQISRGWDTVSGLGQNVLSGMRGIGSDLWGGMQNLGSDIFGGMQNLGSQLGQGISQGWDAMKQGATQGWQNMADMASQGWDAVKTLGSDIAGSIKDGIGGLWSGLKDMLGNVGGPIQDWIQNLIGGNDRKAPTETARGETDQAWQNAQKEQRAARYASGAVDENGNEMDVPDSTFYDATTDNSQDPNYVLGNIADKIPGAFGNLISSELDTFGLSDKYAGWLPGGHEDALFGGQAKWDAEKALSEATAYQASKEARTQRLQAEINSKFGVGNGPGAREARAQLSAIENSQGEAAEGLAFRQADDAYSGGLTQHRAQMQQRGTANSGQDVSGRTRLASGLFGGRANAAMAGEKAKSDFRNVMDNARRQTLGTALFDPVDTTDLRNKRNAVASAKSSAWSNAVGDAAGTLGSFGSAFGQMQG